jgi:hypothetical protein
MNDAAFVLAECLDAIARRELTLDDCAARHPDQRVMLTELIPLAQTLRAAPPIVPSLDFRADARRRLIARLPSRQRARAFERVRAGLQLPQRLLMRALMAVVIVMMLSTSVIAASAQSLPNDLLYPVKITVEQVQWALAPDRLSRGELSLAFASERLNEVERLIQAGRGDAAPIALDGFADQMQAAASMAQSLSDQATHDQLLSNFSRSIDESSRILTQTESRLPASAQSAMQRAKEALTLIPRDSPPRLTPVPLPTLTPTATPAPTQTRRPDKPTSTMPVPSIEPTPAHGLPPLILPTPDSTDVPPTSIAPTLRPTFVPTQWRTLVPTRWPTRSFTPRPTFSPPTLQPTFLPPNWRTPSWPPGSTPHPPPVWPTLPPPIWPNPPWPTLPRPTHRPPPIIIWPTLRPR